MLWDSDGCSREGGVLFGGHTVLLLSRLITTVGNMFFVPLFSLLSSICFVSVCLVRTLAVHLRKEISRG